MYQVEVLPTERFISWLASQGKKGGQVKFPRVLSGAKLEQWKAFVAQSGQ